MAKNWRLNTETNISTTNRFLIWSDSVQGATSLQLAIEEGLRHDVYGCIGARVTVRGRLTWLFSRYGNDISVVNASLGSMPERLGLVVNVHGAPSCN